MSKRCKLQKEYYKYYGNYKGLGTYTLAYVRWLEDEVLRLRELFNQPTPNNTDSEADTKS